MGGVYLLTSDDDHVGLYGRNTVSLHIRHDRKKNWIGQCFRDNVRGLWSALLWLFSYHVTTIIKHGNDYFIILT